MAQDISNTTIFDGKNSSLCGSMKKKQPTSLPFLKMREVFS